MPSRPATVEQVRALVGARAPMSTRATRWAPRRCTTRPGPAIAEIAELLIAHGADVNARHLEAGSTPLITR